MPLEQRRVVTGHDENGKAIVVIDEMVTNVVSSRPMVEAAVIWTTEGFPVDNDGFEERNGAAEGTTLANGTVFRILRLEPGHSPRMHRTDSIDYAIVISGEVDMEMDDSVIHLKAGDVLVQRGTIHNWRNNGPGACTIAFVLIAAKPVDAGGRTLHAEG